MEAFRQYTLYGPSVEEHKVTVTKSFIDQAAKDIRRKLQKIEDKSLRELVQAADKVSHKRETEGGKWKKQKEAEARELQKEKHQVRELKDPSYDGKRMWRRLQTLNYTL